MGGIPNQSQVWVKSPDIFKSAVTRVCLLGYNCTPGESRNNLSSHALCHIRLLNRNPRLRYTGEDRPVREYATGVDKSGDEKCDDIYTCDDKDVSETMV